MLSPIPFHSPEMPKLQTGWWREHFIDHPLKSDRNSTAWHVHGKHKTYCAQCWDHHYAEIQQSVLAADATGVQTFLPRDDQGITNYCE